MALKATIFWNSAITLNIPFKKFMAIYIGYFFQHTLRMFCKFQVRNPIFEQKHAGLIAVFALSSLI